MQEFTVPGPPRGKARPRVTVRGGHAHAYTPETTADYEWFVRHCYKGQVGRYEPMQGAVRVEIEATLAIPKSAKRADRAAMMAGEKLPTKKPDVDNIIKIILDALNGLAWADDAQITHVECRKRYGDQPGVRVLIWTDEEDYDHV